jgi:hypothetical protein
LQIQAKPKLKQNQMNISLTFLEDENFENLRSIRKIPVIFDSKFLEGKILPDARGKKGREEEILKNEATNFPSSSKISNREKEMSEKSQLNNKFCITVKSPNNSIPFSAKNFLIPEKPSNFSKKPVIKVLY